MKRFIATLAAAFIAAYLSVPANAGTTELFMGINARGSVIPLNPAEAQVLGHTVKYGDGWAVWNHVLLQVYDTAEPGTVPVCRHVNLEQGGYFLSLNCGELIPGDSRWKKEWEVFRAKAPKGGACPSGTVPTYSWVNTPKNYAGTQYRFVPGDSPWENSLSDAGWNEVGLEFCLPPQTSPHLTPVTATQPAPTPAFTKTQVKVEVNPNRITVKIGVNSDGRLMDGTLAVPEKFSDVAEFCLWQTTPDGWWTRECKRPNSSREAVFTETPSQGCLQGSLLMSSGKELWYNIDGIQATGLPLVKQVFNTHAYDEKTDQCLAWNGWVP